MHQFYANINCSTDTQLWEHLIKSGERKTLKIIYCQYANLLYNYGMHVTKNPELVKDCIQELFLELLKNHKNLSSTTSVKFYLYKSLRRKIVYEEKKINRQLSYNIQNEEHAYEQGYYEPLEIKNEINHSIKENIRQAVQSLPKRQKEVIQLLFFENLSRDEVAEIMNIDTNSIYALTWKAVKTLRKELQPHHIIFFIFYLFLSL